MLRNGDRVVGEIKSLDHGALSYKTDDMGTLTIKWDKVYSLISSRYFEVETASGQRFYGALQPASEIKRIVVAVTPFVDTLDILNVIRIYPIKRSFLARVDGKVSLAASFQRANELRNIGLDIQADHRTRLRLSQLTTSSYFQAQEGAEATSRNSLSLTQTRFLQSRWLLTAAGQLEQNEELDLDLRVLVGGGGGRFLVQNNRSEALVLGGLAYTNETFSASSSTSNLELLMRGEANYIRRDSPKSDVNARLTVYPNVTDVGRVRTDLDMSASHEFVRDFTVGLRLFHKFDSRPPSEGAEKHDYGFSFTIGWLF